MSNQYEIMKTQIIGVLAQEDPKYVDIAKGVEEKILAFIANIITDEDKEVAAVKSLGTTLAMLELTSREDGHEEYCKKVKVSRDLIG